MTAEAVRRLRETSPFGPDTSKVTQTRMVAKFGILKIFHKVLVFNTERNTAINTNYYSGVVNVTFRNHFSIYSFEY